MEDFRYFLRAILSAPFPKPKKKLRLKKIPIVPSKTKPDEFLLEGHKPFRFSREGAKRKIERRKQ